MALDPDAQIQKAAEGDDEGDETLEPFIKASGTIEPVTKSERRLSQSPEKEEGNDRTKMQEGLEENKSKTDSRSNNSSDKAIDSQK